MRVLFRLQGEREYVGCEMDMGKIAHALNVSIRDRGLNGSTYSRVMST